ncbi:MerR family DNA-binding transcriptional regulator [Beijerinckia sp. L45]|uniref:MerR family transcriptional regulator n=1 Tax=Beijerinckia sp. L45 TaxID=1641855 RepID=UPI001FEFA1C1|nr:MerR family DNA-binding transcriptional regulator [Beijerinckia sp. L45]
MTVLPIKQVRLIKPSGSDERSAANAQEIARSPGAVKGSAMAAFAETETPTVLHDDRFATVTELARELDITARALRFYEDKGLITPRRVANARIYSNRERARMILILRGKRLGFSLREIKDYLDLYDADPKRITQTRALLKKIEIRTQQLEEQRVALDQALIGLKELEQDALAVLAKAERQPESRPTLKRDPVAI